MRLAGITLLVKGSPVNGFLIVGNSLKSPFRDFAVGTVVFAGNGKRLRVPLKSKKKNVRFFTIGPPNVAPNSLICVTAFVRASTSSGFGLGLESTSAIWVFQYRCWA